MTVAEAKRAARARVPVQTCGATAKMHGVLKFTRIQRVSYCIDKYGKEFHTADLIKEVSGRADGILSCDVNDVKLTDDAPEILWRMVYEPDGEYDDNAL